MKPTHPTEFRPARPCILSCLGAALLLTPLTWLQPAAAELPSLSKKPWMGYFGVLRTKNYEFTIGSQGEIRLSPHNKDGEILGEYVAFPIVLGIEEILPDGRVHWLNLIPESLESTDPATEKFEKTVIRGKVVGGAAFEATIEEARGIVSIGGRVTDPGTTTKNPLRFHVRTAVPYFYGHVVKDTPEKRKDFEATIKDDYVETKSIEGKRHKELFITPVNAGSADFTGPGIATAEIGLSLLQSKKLLLAASENSSLKFANANQAPTETGARERPLYEGAVITWTADPAKDPQGRARLAIQVK